MSFEQFRIEQLFPDEITSAARQTRFRVFDKICVALPILARPVSENNSAGVTRNEKTGAAGFREKSVNAPIVAGVGTKAAPPPRGL